MYAHVSSERKSKSKSSSVNQKTDARAQNAPGLTFGETRMGYSFDKPVQQLGFDNKEEPLQGNQVYMGPRLERHLGHVIQMTATEHHQENITPEMREDRIKKYNCTQEVYMKIINEYILEKDIEAISTSTKEQKIAISFRDTGIDSLKRLNEGAGAKGHSILEKTIKDKTLEGCASDAVKGLKGFVAVWKSKEDRAGFPIKGLYLTDEGVKDLKNTDFKDKVKEKDKQPYLEISENDVPSIKALKNWQTFFFTGDYDTHDLVSFESYRDQQVLADSDREKNIIDTLNKRMGEVGKEYKRIQHGPQVNYIAHMVSEEKEKPIVPPVANASFPLAMCNQGKWCIIKGINELREWYKENGINIKNTWSNDTDIWRYIGPKGPEHYNFFKICGYFWGGRTKDIKSNTLIRCFVNFTSLYKNAYSAIIKARENIKGEKTYDAICKELNKLIKEKFTDDMLKKIASYDTTKKDAEVNFLNAYKE